MQARWFTSAETTRAVEMLLGRTPAGAFSVVAYGPSRKPLVLHNAPFLRDGTPMPTSYWLLSSELFREVGRLESAGGVREAERELDPAVVAGTHSRAALERVADVEWFHRSYPLVSTRGVPSGGVGGTRRGVKCLHAHVAHELAGRDDVVGRWALARIGESFAPSAGGVREQ